MPCSGPQDKLPLRLAPFKVKPNPESISSRPPPFVWRTELLRPWRFQAFRREPFSRFITSANWAGSTSPTNLWRKNSSIHRGAKLPCLSLAKRSTATSSLPLQTALLYAVPPIRLLTRYDSSKPSRVPRQLDKSYDSSRLIWKPRKEGLGDPTCELSAMRGRVQIASLHDGWKLSEFETKPPAPRVSQGLPAGVPTIPGSKRPQCNNTARLQSQRHADGTRAMTRWNPADFHT